ncbi:hypothetical protein ASD00_33820 [Ensifer sp. Root31]|nr:aldehyde dehydrogenase family protein [Ensifer sp. Root31]KQU83880.1 hypothetical protein ASD00_33820 [Ensifer sp. Root31]
MKWNPATGTVAAAHGCLPSGCLNGQTLWIGNSWEAAAEGEGLAVISPRDGQALLRIACAKADDIDRAVVSARAALPGWRNMDGVAREKILRAIATGLRANASAFSLLETLDAGRPLRDTVHSAERAAGLFEFYAGLASKIMGRLAPQQSGRTGLIEYEPFGVFAAITPWNYPLSNAVTKLAPILACGNTVVLKPAELTPLVTLLLAEVMAEAGLPTGVVNIVTGDGATGATLVNHPGIDRVSFTGSTATGRTIAEAAARRLNGCILELGGKSPMLVFGDADLARAADAAIFTTFSNQGQTCTSCNRILVDNSVREAFTHLCEERLARLRIGDPLDPATQVGSVVSHGQIERIESLVRDNGGRTIGLPNYRPVPGGAFIRPRIIDVTDSTSPLVREEIFGPVMTLQGFTSDDQAYELANATEYGLAASVWTSSLARSEAARHRIEAGIVWINCVHALSPALPVSGHKNSGMGSEYGLEAIEQHMRLKTTVQMSGAWASPFNND